MAQQDRFAELLSAVAKEVTRRQASEVCCGDLSLEQFQTMQAIADVTQASIGTLSSKQRVDISTMSRNVSVLERHGYLVRARSDGDGRVVLVRLTAKGKRALETLCCDEREVLRDVYERLPAADRAPLIASLTTLRACLDESAVEADLCCPSSLCKDAP
jgi:DNA-binding MarR family transcriptional regulator